MLFLITTSNPSNPRMNYSLFSQLLNHLPKNIVEKAVDTFGTDKHSKGITTFNHLVSMLFCQLASAQSLRDISNGLNSATGNLNHIGMEFAPSKSSLCYLNKHRDWRVFEAIYYLLFKHYFGIFKQKHFRIQSKIQLLDASIVSLCLEAFDWAHFRAAKGGIKLHTVLDYDSCMPSYLTITEGKVHEAKVAKDIILPIGSVVVADRGYLDFELMQKWDANKVRFVVRSKNNIKYTTEKQLPIPNPKEGKPVRILADEKVVVNGYTKALRMVLVRVLDDDGKEAELELLTNNFTWTAETVAELYKQRWHIEIFFRDIKRHLKIKSFVGTSENAVLIQIWTALITMLLLKVLKQKAKHKWCLSSLVFFLRLNIFVKIDLSHWLNAPFTTPNPIPPKVQGQLFLF